MRHKKSIQQEQDLKEIKIQDIQQQISLRYWFGWNGGMASLKKHDH